MSMYLHVLRSREEMASAFIVGTCQVIPKTFFPSSDNMHDKAMSDDPQSTGYVIACGSKAEFYIRPLNTCIGDTDYMVCKANQLAFSCDFPVLPSDLSGLADEIDCYKVQSYPGFPGFVRLSVLGVMKYNWKHKKYEFNRNSLLPEDTHVFTDMVGELKSREDHVYRILGKNKCSMVVSGPAIKTPSKQFINNDFTGIDSVFCLFCPQWPRDAQDWPFRPKENGWPTSDLISEVVRNGCHVVYVQHRACRDNIEQWRLSFSVAEVILLQSFTKTQQIVYHLLRFFAKRELIKNDCLKEDQVLCGYHLKTLLLWTCEEMPAGWWASYPVIAICCELLNILSDWLQRKYYPNFFIPEANLFHHPSTFTLLQQTQRRLNDFQNFGILSRWFIENYILPITRTRFQFLNTQKVTPDFIDYMLPLLEFRKAAMPRFLDYAVALRSVAFNYSSRHLIITQCTGTRGQMKIEHYSNHFYLTLHKLMPCYPTTEKVSCFKYYNFLLYSLQFAHSLSNGEMSCDYGLLVEFLNVIYLKPNIIRSQYHNFPKTFRPQSSRFQFTRAQDLMENLTGLNSNSEFKLLSLMSRVFLIRTLQADGSESNGVTTATLAYLAAIHFVSSEYQPAIRLCIAVLTDQTPPEENETLNAGCLLFIDDIARSIGLCVLHKKITDINFRYIFKRLYLDLRISPQVFAHYLTVLSTEKKSTHLGFWRELPDSSYPMDNNVIALIKPIRIATIMPSTQRNDARQILYRRIDSSTETEATATNPLVVKETVIDLLMEFALENMTSFYSMILKDFGMQ